MREEAERPFVVPCRRLTWSAPWRWLRAGWRDVRRAPGLTAFFGMVIVLVSAVVSLLAWRLGRFALLALLLSGFVYVAPLIGVGLYSVSRALHAGHRPRLRDSFTVARRVMGQAGIFALVQLVIMLVWSRAGMMLTAFVPVQKGVAAGWMEYLAIGSLIGAVFAAFTFAVSVVSLPLIADRSVDMVTACVSSLNAVLRNKRVMLLWGLLIVVLTLVGFVTVVGLGLVMPWLAYATWHAARDTLDASDWPAA
ncbi:DUF2189 domain-containing protein [Oleiagrimonas sp. MCCC 1A03011]|uniref:DUF2189 domain-containing protein n=1 Tax=Oleiagrimonas sp. MCCC 1A03011 TaxID=1926883 RepID=UPI000DC452B6|nr:DUF2189 domain-containing protein [Oleiagrimonas sp. MCCC 1A03011]RAP56147.1 hypothetical protein BTJ49_14570 [Oleiagrimonas sp. MCCC 1A03011]